VSVHNGFVRPAQLVVVFSARDCMVHTCRSRQCATDVPSSNKMQILERSPGGAWIPRKSANDEATEPQRRSTGVRRSAPCEPQMHNPAPLPMWADVRPAEGDLSAGGACSSNDQSQRREAVYLGSLISCRPRVRIPSLLPISRVGEAPGPVSRQSWALRLLPSVGRGYAQHIGNGGMLPTSQIRRLIRPRIALTGAPTLDSLSTSLHTQVPQAPPAESACSPQRAGRSSRASGFAGGVSL
jgi:hypothetical protein